MHYLGMRHKLERRQGRRTSSKTPYIRFLDKLTLVVGVIGPFTVLPQIYSIFTTHSATGVSALTWTLMFVVTLPWIFYGLAHRDIAITASFILWEVANALVIVGALMYGHA